MDFTQLPAILTPDIGLLFWMLLAFLVVFICLAKWGFPAITGMVEERNRFIDESLRKAHEAEERLANAKALLENNVPLEVIVKSLGLTDEEAAALQS